MLKNDLKMFSVKNEVPIKCVCFMNNQNFKYAEVILKVKLI